MSEQDLLLLPPEIQAAYRDAKARGLPDGWTCTIDKRNRRKWTAPGHGRSCDSIPKALAISVEMGLLPPDTYVPSGIGGGYGGGGRKRVLVGSGGKRNRGGNKRRKQPPPSSSDGTRPPSASLTADAPGVGSSAVGDALPPVVGRSGLTTTGTTTTTTTKPLLSSGSQHGTSSGGGGASDTTKPRPKPPPLAATQSAVTSAPTSDDEPSSSEEEEEEEERDDEDIVNDPPPVDMDPERSLEYGFHRKAPPTTVHWDPHDRNGNKVGWKIRIETGSAWLEGRVVRYDPYTHKHKIQWAATTTTTTNFSKKGTCSNWIWLRNDQHNLLLATRMVWAHVKGYAWWPALVMESNHSPDDNSNNNRATAPAATYREGYVHVAFFGSDEVATLRDAPEFIRPFSANEIDPVVARHKKKRNAKAFALACDEYHAIRQCRNDAALYYAERALHLARYVTPRQLVGRKIEIHRTDVNYPYGDTVTASVRAYSFVQKKWLLSYDYTPKSKTKYDASWINVIGKKECSGLEVLDDKKQPPDLAALVPFLVGFQSRNNSATSDAAPPDGVDDPDASHTAASASDPPRQAQAAALLAERCRGCVEVWKKDDLRVECHLCEAEYHLGCVDPPLTMEAWQRMLRDGTDFVCSKCVTCRACYQKDIVFGSHTKSPLPPTLSFPKGQNLSMCYMCTTAYEEKRYCPNCGHAWDHDKYEAVHQQIEYAGALHRLRGKLGGAAGTLPVADTNLPPTFGSFVGDDRLPLGAKVDPSCFYAETTEWGFSEIEMLVCDGCDVWVHAGCSGLTEDEYDLTSDGKHPIYSKEFLCRICCRNRCRDLIEALHEQDKLMLFAVPVNEKVAPNYHDVIKNPMDLETMTERANTEEYQHYAWVRELFELMVLNALTFNRSFTAVWNEAKRFYHDSLSLVFARLGKAAPAGKYATAIQDCFQRAEDERKMEEDRVQVDETVEKKDLVAGSLAASVTLPKMRESPPDQGSCVAFAEVKLKPVDAFFCSWMECCYICGSSGAMDTMLFCVDCGEAYHTFCASAPIHSMDEFSAAGWRCPNCKICEISGDVPQDENRMLFCEMCDRAFSLDLLDPPLSTAPSGLWICGQCVDCKVCCNTAEDGASLKFWSRDPEKCFRCGGCGSVVDDYMDKAECLVCTKLLRSKDSIVQCGRCNGHVHLSCDAAAERHFAKICRATESNQPQENVGSYFCPKCGPGECETQQGPDIDLEWFRSQALSLINNSVLKPDETTSEGELYSKLIEQVQWALSDLWKEEYLEIFNEGVRVFGLVKVSFQDPRFIAQHALSGATGLPMYIIQRALRFVFIVKRSRWDAVDSAPPERIEVIVQSAKLATAFLMVANAALNLDISQDLINSDRFTSLAESPDECGQMEFPTDRLKAGELVEYSVLDLNLEKSTPPTASGAKKSTPEVPPKMASALCGWSMFPEIAGQSPTWKDPRECCLCHLRGDDDAGFLDLHVSENDADTNDVHLGRLLPLFDGGFVHTGCALWSSEVWEDSNDSLVYAVDKARCRGSQLKCFGCGFYGATVGCNKSNCLLNYHLPCAKYCGAVFTSNQHVFCANHRSSATGILDKVTFEPMKTLTVAPEKKVAEKDFADGSDGDLCYRVGALVVHSLGCIETNYDGFHSENYITPPGYVATRIFWSSSKPRSRTIYFLKVESDNNLPRFVITPGDNLSVQFTGGSAAQAYAALLDRVRRINNDMFSQGDLLSKLPAVRRTRRKTFGLNGPQFFGFGLDQVRKALEASPGVEAVVAPLTSTSPKYRFCFHMPQLEVVKDLIRKRAAIKAERALENSSGCARTEGIRAVARSGGSGRITRALVRSAEEETLSESVSGAAITKKGEEKAKVDRNLTQVKYRRMKAVPIEQRLAVRRSHIHGWGLFNKGADVPKDDPIVEYMGETIRQPIADQRERAYEVSGEGSCYMFRLDLHRIVDATKIGCMARFMNHSCKPNAYAKIISVDTEGGAERKIVVFANRLIASGEEITYDYKFPVEDGSLRCTCGAPNCIGRLN